MKILHTSDLHIGKKLIVRDRLDEYRAVFDEFKNICVNEGVELLIIAGDVFDTYTPSAEAEEIFYKGIKLLSEVCAVLIISGNHDDYVRLTAAATLAEEHNVYIIGNSLVPVTCAKRGDTYPIKSGCGWVIFQNRIGEKVHINALPYPNEARFKEGRSEETFEEKMSRWIGYGEEGKENIPSVFVSHMFVAGGAVSESEREIDLGGARAVSLNLLPACDYIALGHLHKRQDLGKNVHYCGAPMQFSFDESGAEKSVNVFDLTANGVENFKRIPVTSPRKLIKLQVNGVSDGIALLTANRDCYVELTLNLCAPITPQESAALHEQENLVSLKVEMPNAEMGGKKISNKHKSSSQLFTDYYKLRFGADVPEELLALFLSMTEEE